MFLKKFYFIFYCVLVRVTVYVGCPSGVINDDDDDSEREREFTFAKNFQVCHYQVNTWSCFKKL